MSIKEKAKISICIPVYNGAEFLEKALQSLQKQTYSKWEAIIIDDGSSDQSFEIAKRFHLQDPRFEIYQNQKNLGMVRNWNQALKIAQGDYICFLHQDDYYQKFYLQEVNDYFKLHPEIAMVFTANYNIDEAGKILEINRPFSEDKIFNIEDFAYLLSQKGNFIKFPTVMIKKEVYGKRGFYNESLHLTVDLEMWLRISLYSKIAYLDKNLSFYRVHDNSVSSSYIKKGSEIKELEKCYHLFLSEAKKFLSSSSYSKIENWLWTSIDHRLLNRKHLLFILKFGGREALKNLYADYQNFRNQNLSSIPRYQILFLEILMFFLIKVPFTVHLILSCQKLFFKLKHLIHPWETNI